MRIDAAHCRRAPGAVPMRFPAPFRSDTLSSVALSACPRRLNQGRQERLVTGPCAHTLDTATGHTVVRVCASALRWPLLERAAAACWPGALAVATGMCRAVALTVR